MTMTLRPAPQAFPASPARIGVVVFRVIMGFEVESVTFRGRVQSVVFKVQGLRLRV